MRESIAYPVGNKILGQLYGKWASPQFPNLSLRNDVIKNLH